MPGIHHVTVGAVADDPYFRDDQDRIGWVRMLVAVSVRFAWTCLIFCEMTTHVHLVVDVPDESLPLGMHRLNGDYANVFNDRHGLRGHVQRARYWSERKAGVGDVLAAYRYVALNPVEAGMVSDPARWAWSSLATSLGLSDGFSFVDASPLAAELGGVDGLRRFVTG